MNFPIWHGFCRGWHTQLSTMSTKLYIRKFTIKIKRSSQCKLYFTLEKNVSRVTI